MRMVGKLFHLIDLAGHEKYLKLQCQVLLGYLLTMA